MSWRLDHVVVAVRDLEAAMADYRALGFQVLVGGQHTGRLSHNALVVFDDGAYLELIAWRGDNDEPWHRVLQADGEGLVDHALWPPAIAHDVAAARRRGLHSLGDVVDGGRLRPDGQAVAWRSARQATRALPFLCADVTPRALRVPEGAARQQPNGVRGVQAVVVAVPALAPARADLAALLGQPVADGAGDLPPAALPAWLRGPDVLAAHAALDGCHLLLVAPAGAAAPDTPAAPTASSAPAAPAEPAHPLARRLARRGPGPCALLLRTAQAPSAAAATVLDPALSHGAELVRV